jgi:hypothetical protein
MVMVGDSDVLSFYLLFLSWIYGVKPATNGTRKIIATLITGDFKNLRGYMGAIPITTTTKNQDNAEVLQHTMDGPLLYLHDHKVIVCSLCCHCIKADGVDLHLQRFHKDTQVQSSNYRKR